jgi:hypothetical protein
VIKGVGCNRKDDGRKKDGLKVHMQIHYGKVIFQHCKYLKIKQIKITSFFSWSVVLQNEYYGLYLQNQKDTFVIECINLFNPKK